jgi:hypothetical protein
LCEGVSDNLAGNARKDATNQSDKDDNSRFDDYFLVVMVSGAKLTADERPSDDESALSSSSNNSSNALWTPLKLIASAILLYTAFSGTAADDGAIGGRRLTALGDTVPSYMDALMADLRARKKLFEETPPEEVKYWFEYTGPLQVSWVGQRG